METFSQHEKHPFLGDSSSLSSPTEGEYRHVQRRCSWNGAKLALTFVMLLSLMFNTYFLMDCMVSSQTESHPFSPADQAKIYNITNIRTRNCTSQYVGPPREEFDRAWSDLLSGTSIEVTADELRKAGRKSLKLRDQEGYLGSLEVYHQLHCVKRMVQGRYPEHYPGLMEHGQLSSAHFDHCIEVLRKGIMCSADTSLNTVTWDPLNLTHMKGVTDGPRKCVNWDHLEQWVKSRPVHNGHPVLGVDEPGFMGPDGLSVH